MRSRSWILGGLALAATACGPEVEGTYQVQEYRQNTLTCDEVGHAGGGPSHVRLAPERGRKVLRLDRCPEGPASCVSDPTFGVEFNLGTPKAWRGKQVTSSHVGTTCTFQRREHKLTVDGDGRLHVELRSWSGAMETQLLAGPETACAPEDMGKLEAPLQCDRYEVFELVEP